MAERTLNRRSRRRDEVEDDQYDERDARDDQDDEEPPRRGRGRSRRDDDEDEAPRGRRSSRRSRDDDDDEDEPPRRGRRSSRRDPEEDDEPRSRRSSRRGRDDDDDDEPRGRGSKPNSTSKGWGGFKAKRQETSDYVKNYVLPDKEAEIIKVMDDEPFSVYAEHWLDEKQGKKSYVCIGEGCPLCAIGDKPRVYALFNVVDLRDPENPTVYPWKVSQTVTDILEGFASDKKTSPINREDLYFSVRKTGGGKKGRVQTVLNPVKARDLLEDWDIEPFSEAELDDFTLYEEDDVLEFTSKKTLKVIADELDD
jgi:hypothetical protein